MQRRSMTLILWVVISVLIAVLFVIRAALAEDWKPMYPDAWPNRRIYIAGDKACPQPYDGSERYTQEECQQFCEECNDQFRSATTRYSIPIKTKAWHPETESYMTLDEYEEWCRKKWKIYAEQIKERGTRLYHIPKPSCDQPPLKIEWFGSPITAKEFKTTHWNIEIGLREDGVVVWRKSE